MTSIFVSHSRLDKDIVSFFSTAFSLAGVKQHLMEFELTGGFPAREIITKILSPDTSALFVLLGDGLLNRQHTVNWVTFEVGVASAVGKDIWVFERYEHSTEFPVPYTNHYLLYNLDSDDHLKFIREKIEAYHIWWGPTRTQSIMTTAIPVNCIKCGGSYSIHSTVEEFQCPLCRAPLRWQAPPTGTSPGES